MKNFGAVPSVRFNRSKFNLSHGLKTSMSVGYLYPVDVQEVLPGDSFKTNIHNVARVTSSFIKPVIDNLFMDIYSFFVPLRLINEDNDRVFGNPNPSAYVDNELLDMPTNKFAMVVQEKTVGDYLGLPTGVQLGVGQINLLPFRAFALIYDQWFRNENIIDEMFINKSKDGNDAEVCNFSDWSPLNYFGKLPKVGKKKDYFTSCLPNTQKGASVNLNLGTVAPVLAGSVDNDLNGSSPLRLYANTSSGFMAPSSDTTVGVNNINGIIGTNLNFNNAYQPGVSLYPANLFADLSSATASNVNDVRFAFQLQKMLERDALYGSRYNEYLLGHFGVYSPDGRLQFAECLGGGRVPISIQQVEQTSQASEESPLGNVAGYSWTVGKSRYSKGFTEHGYIMTVACLRQVHTYQQGVPKMFLRKNRNDIYDPLFANIGEQPVYTSELYVLRGSNVSMDLKDSVFGYNEAWAEYRYNPSKITGEMRSNASNSLDIWHFGDNYSSQPFLVKDFIEESPTFVDRTLSVPSTSQDQFIVDWWFDKEAIRVMPTYSVPGLIDHH